MSSSAWLVCTSTIKSVKEAYNIKRWQVDFLNVIYLVMYIPINFIAVFLIEKRGMRTSMLTGTFMQLIGFWLKTLVNKSFIFMMLGQTLIAIGFPFVFNMPQKLAAAWFITKHRELVTIAGTSMFMLGCSFSFIWPIASITFPPIGEEIKDWDHPRFRQEFQRMILV